MKKTTVQKRENVYNEGKGKCLGGVLRHAACDDKKRCKTAQNRKGVVYL